jgi:hypothetical protein
MWETNCRDLSDGRAFVSFDWSSQLAWKLKMASINCETGYQNENQLLLCFVKICAAPLILTFHPFWTPGLTIPKASFLAPPPH